MKPMRMVFLAAALLIINSAAVPAYSQTATMRSNPAAATITSRGIDCAALNLTPVVTTNSLFGPEPISVFLAGVLNATGHGAITAALENRDGAKADFINQPYDDETPFFSVIELFISSLNPKMEGPFSTQPQGDRVKSVLRYFVSPGSFSLGTFVFTIRGILHEGDVSMFDSTQPKFKCSGAGMVEIRLPFSLVYE
jgi:hypothetical protein